MLQVRIFCATPRRVSHGRSIRILHARTPSDLPKHDAAVGANGTNRVGDIMSPNPICVYEDTPLADVARIMNSARISGVPVLRARSDERELGGPCAGASHIVGVLSETDLLLSYPPKEDGARREYYIPPMYIPMLDTIFSVPKSKQFTDDVKRMLALNAGDLMSKPAIIISEDSSISDAARLMIRNRVNRLPVLAADESERLVGVVTRDDVVSFMATHQFTEE